MANLQEACVHELRSLAAVKGKRHVGYLHEYLGTLQCATIVVEDSYVDRDFLDDFSSYYVTCFAEYERFCRRLHFFKEPFDQKAWNEFIRGRGALTAEKLRQPGSYLGHVVLKPLPGAFVGRTCLATYGPDGGRRKFPMTRPYTAHLAGVELTVDSLAFQEQDTVLAACATSAVWSALHKSAKFFGTKIPTPANITSLAGRHFLQKARSLPSHGLSVYQICQVIKELGLEVEIREGAKIKDLRALVYAYGQYGLPSILALQLEDNGVVVDYHAVTVSGYSMGPAAGPLTLVSDRMDKLYVHDDQTGPFSRAVIKGPTLIGTGFPSPSGNMADGVVTAVIIPLYHKIRITFEEAWEEVARLDWLLHKLQRDIVWDVRLVNAVDFQAEVAAGTDPHARQRVLERNWPRFLWRATCMLDDKPILDVLIDSTDIQRAFFVEMVVVHSPDLRRALTFLFEQKGVLDILRQPQYLGPWMGLLVEAAKE